MLLAFNEAWPKGEQVVANFLPKCILPSYPDYARIVESEQEDRHRLDEFRRPFTPQQLLQSFAERKITAPMGPYGALEDIFWFNYFGRVYVDLIGKKRLVGSGWAHVKEVGDGLACYASESIDDSRLRKKRDRIAMALGEYVWTPGCKADDKRVPDFDFSEQLRNEGELAGGSQIG